MVPRPPTKHRRALRVSDWDSWYDDDDQASNPPGVAAKRETRLEKTKAKSCADAKSI